MASPATPPAPRSRRPAPQAHDLRAERSGCRGEEHGDARGKAGGSLHGQHGERRRRPRRLRVGAQVAARLRSARVEPLARQSRPSSRELVRRERHSGALELAQPAVADQLHTQPVRRGRAHDGSSHRYTWSSTRQPIAVRGAQLVGVDPRMQVHLGDARPQVEQRPARSRARAPTGASTKWSGNTTPSSAASRRNGKPTSRSPLAPAMRSGRREVDRQLEVHVEELGPQLQRAHVAVEVAHVEAPAGSPARSGPGTPCAPRRGRRGPTRRSTVRGNPPSPSSRLGACVIGPQR